MKQNKVILTIAVDAMFLALIALFSFIPNLGYITLGPISFTTIHILVLVGALLLGRKQGAILGLIFGVFSFLVCLQYPGTINYLFINPFVSILPRVLFGYISGLLFDIFKKKLDIKDFIAVAAPLCGALTLLHTFLTLCCLYVFGYLDIFKISAALNLTDIIEANNAAFGSFGNFILAFIAPGTACEVAASIILCPLIMLALYKALSKSNYVTLGIIKRFNETSLLSKKATILIVALISLVVVALVTTILCLFYLK